MTVNHLNRVTTTINNLLHRVARVIHPNFFNRWQARVWDYVFYFAQDENSVISYQMKMIFDKDERVTHYFWKPVDPYKGTCPDPFH